LTVGYVDTSCLVAVAFAEPGHLKAVVAFSLHAQDGGGTLLSCEGRVRATDEDTRSTLHMTWFVVGAGLRMLARRLLDQIKAEAELRPVGR